VLKSRFGVALLAMTAVLALPTAGAAAKSHHRHHHKAQAKSATSNEASLVADLDAYFRTLPPAHFYGAFTVAKGDKIILSKGYGYADLNQSVPITPANIIGIGSISKTFTQTAILRLIHQGKIGMNDTLKKYFPDVPADRQDITIYQMLTHTSGLAQYASDGDFLPLTRAQFLDSAWTQDLRFTPAGSREAYGDVEYGTLAVIIEMVTGREYQSYIRDTILNPLHMDHTGWYNERLAPSRLYALTNIPPELGTVNDNDPENWPMSWSLRGAGGMVSTNGDLWKWSQAMCHATILTPADVALTEQSPFRRWTVGWELRDVGIGKTILKGGSDDFGNAAMVARMKDADYTLITQFNQKDPDGDPAPHNTALRAVAAIILRHEGFPTTPSHHCY
jgi:CubicO group peptidase (beta-lactamase class C family)